MGADFFLLPAFEYSEVNGMTIAARRGLRFCVLCLILIRTPGLAADDSKSLKLTMDTAVSIGAANYFALQANQGKQLAIRQLITERWRAYLPAFGVSYNRIHDINKGETDSLSQEVRINIEQIIYDGGRRSLDLDLARIQALLTRDDFRVTYNKLRLDIQKAYLHVLSEKGQILLNSKSLERAKEELRLVRREEQLGFATRVQVLTVAARLREIELARQQAEIAYRQGLHDFQALLNLDFDTELELEGDLFTDFYLLPPSIPVRDLISSARTLRAEVGRSKTNLHRLNKERELAEDSWIPRVSLNGYVGRTGPALPVRDRSWGVNLTLSFPIGSTTSETQAGGAYSKGDNSFSSNQSTTMKFFDDLSYDRRVLESRIAMGEAIAEQRQLDNQLAIEVTKAYDNVRSQWESIRIGNGRVYFQFESLRLLHARFGVGEVKRADILLQETELVRAQEDLTKAISDYLIGVYELEYAAGRDPGVLGLFRNLKGGGNTILPYLIHGDINKIRQMLDRANKQEEFWLLDRVPGEGNGPGKSNDPGKFLIDEIEKKREGNNK